MSIVNGIPTGRAEKPQDVPGKHCKPAVRLIVVAFGLLVTLPVRAQTTTALVIHNLALDHEKHTVDFEAVNQSDKPVRSWLMRVAIKMEIPPGETWPATLVLTSEACTHEAGAQLAPGQTRSCSAHLEIGEPDIILLEADAKITAVLFEDGTAEGDLHLLDFIINERRMRLGALQYWQERFQAARKAASAIEQIRAFEKMLFSGDPLIPDELLCDSTAMRERRNLQSLVSNLIQGIENHGFDATAASANLAVTLQQKIQETLAQSRSFPSGERPYAPPLVVALKHPITNLTSGFHLVRAEEEGDSLVRLVLRNGYDKEIVEYALTLRQPNDLMLISKSYREAVAGHAIAPGTVAEFRYDALLDTDPPLEIACVIFRDGTADGDPAAIQKLNDTWAGRQAEAARVVPLLRAIGVLPEPEMAAATDRLIAHLEAQNPEEPDADRSISLVMGMQKERQMLIRDLQQLRKQNPSPYKAELIGLTERLAQRLRK